jgi:ABC-type nitrate/sulfonate/bicarbonate transport system substrate-binding protein
LWVARTKWLQEQPEAARRLIKAMDLATQALSSNPGPAVKAVAETLAISPEMAEQILRRDHYPTLVEMVSSGYRSSLTARNGYSQGLQEQAQFMYDQRFINVLPNIAEAIDAGPVNDYLKSR